MNDRPQRTRAPHWPAAASQPVVGLFGIGLNT